MSWRPVRAQTGQCEDGSPVGTVVVVQKKQKKKKKKKKKKSDF